MMGPSKSNHINAKLFDDLKEKLESDGYGHTKPHPAWVLFNNREEIIQSILIKEKIEKYSELFPETKLLRELLS